MVFAYTCKKYVKENNYKTKKTIKVKKTIIENLKQRPTNVKALIVNRLATYRPNHHH